MGAVTSTPAPYSSDPTAALRRGVRYGLLGLLVLAVGGAIVASLFAGVEGLWGALLGAAVGGGFILCTALAVLLTAKLPAVTAGAVLLGSWLLKMILAITVLAILDPLDFYNRQAMVIVIVLSLVIVLGAETYGVMQTKVPYVTPAESDDDGGTD
ncbi:hypothetical protein AB4Z09_18035 [Rhodococcus sp. TAF43]|uniref:hypothetical protein n=1 Tax=unclassified Rhodococcus (in: high G+C Gram-positive bacteria) TaxID=192944 RepID=UPI001583CAFB|nr:MULTISPECIES: hypothetical protein [unclassified Rhodococcus (in: high G+C Gram-positive bacteria)]QKT14058.1 hypothetical protein HUN07_10155 [Rhodococcus sp. W8901]